MKLVVKKEILLESLNNTARAISTKNLTDVSIRSFIPKNKLTSLEETC